MKLRPHHLLCTQGYRGKGYNSAFVENMSAMTNRLRQASECEIELVFGADAICGCCPLLSEQSVCQDNDKVSEIDRKVIAYFALEPKRYLYQEITQSINAKMTAEIMADICGQCEWYPISACRKTILG